MAERTSIFYCPPAVNFGYLNPGNGKFYSDSDIERFKKHITKEGVYSFLDETELKIKLLYSENKLYALSPEQGQKGAYSTTRLVQDLETGEFFLAKKQKSKNPLMFFAWQSFIDNEMNELKKVGGIAENADKKSIAFYTQTNHAKCKKLKTNHPHCKQGHKCGEIKDHHPRCKQKQKHQRDIDNHIDTNVHYSIVKYVPGEDLLDLVSENKLSVLEWFNIAIQLLQELQKLHDLGILHRDLKLENVRYDRSTGKLVIIDFGLSADMNFKDTRRYSERCGTPGYIAPEVLDFMWDHVYTKAADVYSIGILLRIMFGFVELDEHDVFKVNTLPRPYNTTVLQDNNLQNLLKNKLVNDFTARMTSVNLNERPKPNEAIEFFDKIKHQLNKDDRLYKVGIVKVQDYLSASSKEEFISDLLQFHRVYLVDSQPRAKFLHTRIQNEIEKFRIPVARDVYASELAVRQSLQVNDLGYVYSFNTITPKRMISSFSRFLNDLGFFTGLQTPETSPNRTTQFRAAHRSNVGLSCA